MFSPAAPILSIMLAAVTLSPVAFDARDALREDAGQPAGPVPAATHDVLRAADGLFYVHATVNGRRVRFLVDTGASVVTLTANDAERLGVAPARERYVGRVRTVGGQARMAWTSLDHVDVAGRSLDGVQAAVVRGGLGVSLLGQNLLSRMEQVTIEGDLLRLR